MKPYRIAVLVIGLLATAFVAYVVRTVVAEQAYIQSRTMHGGTNVFPRR